MVAAYDIQHLIKACDTASNVYVSRTVLEDAKMHFKLLTLEAICKFIASDGLEKLQIINTKALEKSPCPELNIMVDAYGFYSGKKQGYIAFYFNEKTQKWIIKSFKENANKIPRSTVLENNLILSGLIISSESQK
jgi:hypothetical protein